VPTYTTASPTLRAGDVTTSSVGLALTMVAVAPVGPPNLTLWAHSRSVPVIVTVAPPLDRPDAGLIEVTTGAFVFQAAHKLPLMNVFDMFTEPSEFATLRNEEVKVGTVQGRIGKTPVNPFAVATTFVKSRRFTVRLYCVVVSHAELTAGLKKCRLLPSVMETRVPPYGFAEVTVLP
jgi:hypothetical protein